MEHLLNTDDAKIFNGPAGLSLRIPDLSEGLNTYRNTLAECRDGACEITPARE